MTKLWIEWKTNGRFPTRSTVPWKSRKGGEIPTFPQLRRLLSHAQKTGEQKTEDCGRVEIQNQDSHFSTAPKACGARKVPGQHPFAPDATHTKQRGGDGCCWSHCSGRRGSPAGKAPVAAAKHPRHRMTASAWPVSRADSTRDALL